MYDIVEQTPLYQSWTRQAYAEGEQQGLERGRREGKLEGKLEGQLETLRHMLVNLVQRRFPHLVSLAQTRAAQLQDPAGLEALILAVSTAKQVKEARSLLRGQEQGEQEQHTS
jgi:flagellar biosynthesis/type III secretory pathway protein FliH